VRFPRDTASTLSLMYPRLQNGSTKGISDLCGASAVTIGAANTHPTRCAGGAGNPSLWPFDRPRRATRNDPFPYSSIMSLCPSTYTANMHREQAPHAIQAGASKVQIWQSQHRENHGRAAVLSLVDPQPSSGKATSIYKATNGKSVAAPPSKHSRQVPTAVNTRDAEVTGLQATAQCHQATAPTASVPTQQTLPELKKAVSWVPVTKVAGIPGRGILRRFGYGKRWTFPFSLEFTICARRYTVDFNPLESHKACIEKFENELVRRVAAEHQETLRAFFAYHEYSLTFTRSGATLTTVIPTDCNALRDAAFKTFLNAIPEGAKVTLD
jgi:hypothetical protein